jgi:Subtilase family
MMKPRNLIGLPLALTVALLATCAAMNAAEQRDLVVHVGKLTPELVATIATIGEARTVRASKDTDILKVVSDYCGSANARRDYYLRLFLAANSSNDDIRTGKTILSKDAELQIPACLFADEKPTAVLATASGLKWDKPITVSNNGALASIDTGAIKKWLPNASDAGKLNTTVVASILPGQSVNYERLKPSASWELPQELDDQGPSLINQVDSRRLKDQPAQSAYDKLVKKTFTASGQLKPPEVLASAKYDTSPAATEFERAVRTQDVLASNQSTDLTKLKTGSALVTSDFTPGQYSVKLKPDQDSKKAALQVVASLPSGPDASVAVTSNYLGYIAEPPTPAESNCSTAPASQWPINVSELSRVLSLRSKFNRKPTVGKLLIVDTGFPPGQVDNAPFAAGLFVRKVGNVIDPLHEPFLWTTIKPPDPPQYFYPGMKNGDHGIGVLTLALGGPEVLKQKLLPSNVVSQGGTVISLMAYKSVGGAPELNVNGEAAVQSLSGSNWGQAAVAGVNLSLQFSTEYASGNFNGVVKDHPIILYVFAAGNDTKDLSVEVIQPADWGGDRNNNAITVGAANPDGTYWVRSNWSTARVDLAAPGCAVPSLGWNNVTSTFKDVRLSGTSVAAPLVSFAGNLLRDLVDPVRIKSRILSSGRYFLALGDKVRSKRMLDVPTALALQFDAIRDSNGKLRLGRIVNWPESGFSICSAKRPAGELAQISRADGLANVNIVVKNKFDTKTVGFPPTCPLAADTELAGISFREIDETAADIAWKDAEPLDIRNLQSITFCEVCDLNP